jgi:carboxylate-amine ligase
MIVSFMRGRVASPTNGILADCPRRVVGEHGERSEDTCIPVTDEFPRSNSCPSCGRCQTDSAAPPTRPDGTFAIGGPIWGQHRTMNPRSVGVEEELLLVEPRTGQPQAVAGTVLQAARQAAESAADPDQAGDNTAKLELELQQQQLETNSQPCHSLSDLHRELRRCRAFAAATAGRAGTQVVALGTSPVAVEPQVVDDSRYRRMSEAFGLTAHEQLTCGCHVHVEISSAEEGVAVLDRIGPRLATLLALSANSPFWQGLDSAYASYRYQAWGRWPCSGPTEPFGTVQRYRETLRQMVRTRTLLDTGMVYFNARLSERYPTIEIRIADVCLRTDDAVLVAALARALVETEARAARSGHPTPPARTELLRLAAWRASRSGLDDVLLHPVTGLPEPAADVAHALADHCRDALVDAGDADTVTELLAALLARGNGAAFQRAAYRRSGRLADVIANAVTVTGDDGQRDLPLTPRRFCWPGRWRFVSIRPEGQLSGGTRQKRGRWPSRSSST